jgi:serine/threonine-protein phosphatase 6 regulatory subunit 3
MNEQTQLLIPFWETVLDRSAEDMKTEMVMASHFAKINAVFLSKKPAEVNRPSYTNVFREYRVLACI